MSNKNSTGDRSTGNWSTGDRSTGSWSTGSWSTGNRSTGNWSTGTWSTGDMSTGYNSTGYNSTGDNSTGNWSTGNLSTGNMSTGSWSISSWSTGHFSTEDYGGFGAFNKPCTPEEWNNAIKPNFLYSVSPTRWIPECEMTDKEKENNPSFKTTGGYLKTVTMKESWAEAWANKGKDDEAQLRALPNFDAKVFEEISGIDVDVSLCSNCGQELKQ